MQSSISPEDISNAQIVLNHFVYLLPTLYAERYLSANVHDLLHLPECVKDAGPLHVYSCFAFESTNHALVRLIYGTQAVPQQVAHGIANLQCIPLLAKDLVNSGNISSHGLDLLEKLIQFMFSTDSSKVTVCLGKGRSISLNGDQTHSLAAILNDLSLQTVYIYQRIKLNNIVLDSMAYTRTEKRINSCVAFKTLHNKLSYGIIKYFLSFPSSPNHTVIAVLNILCPRESNLSTNTITGATAAHIKIVDWQPEDEYIPVESITMRCVFMKIENVYYVSQFPNLMESD